MKSFIGTMVAALGLASQPRRERAVDPALTPEQEKARLKRAWLCSRTSSKPFAERQKIQSERAKLEEPRRIRKAARAARKANRS